ncbi:MAG: PTS sugar transporter subunit IIA [Candidatus Rokuibacteriota bacterium]
MSDALRGVVVCHGGLAKALVEAAESISGVTGVLLPVSNSGCDRESLEKRVAEAAEGRPSVLFVDLASGSCLFAVLKRMRALPDVKVVTGVNLAMLVDFVFHVSLTPEAAAERAIAAGTTAIRIP